MDDVERSLALTPLSVVQGRAAVLVVEDAGSRSRRMILGAPQPSACTALPAILRRIPDALREPDSVPFSSRTANPTARSHTQQAI